MGFFPFFTQAQQLAGGTIPGNLTVNPGNLTISGSVTAGSSPGGPFPELVQTTGVGGFALQNGTPTILSWTAPNDGNEHRFLFYGARTVTVAETGGAMVFTYTPPGGGAAIATTVAGGTSGVGTGGLGNVACITGVAAANTVVSLAQSSALTAGACQVNAEIWAS